MLNDQLSVAADASLEHRVAKVGCCSLVDKAVLGLLMQMVQLVRGEPVWLLVVVKEVEDARQLIVRPACFACRWWKRGCHGEGNCRAYGVVDGLIRSISGQIPTVYRTTAVHVPVP